MTDQRDYRICVFVPALNEGGAERVMVRLANAFSLLGFTVDLVAASLTGPYINEISHKVNVIDLGSSRTLTSVVPLMRYLRHYQPDALLSTLTHANIVAVVAVKLARVSTRVVVREAGLPTLDQNQSLKQRPSGILRIAKWVFPHADCVVGVSNGVVDELTELLRIEHKVKHAVIYNPVISDTLYKLSAEALEEKYQTIFCKPVVLGVGRLADEKDFPTLIQAFAEVRKTVDCHLLILGSGTLELQLKKQCIENGVEDFVFMPGFVNNPYPFIKHCAVYVLSSISEGLPNALIESLALGVPVVSTRIVNGPSEILEDGKWGSLVPVGDAQAMALGIVSTLQSKPALIPETDPWWQRFSEAAVVDAYLKTLVNLK